MDPLQNTENIQQMIKLLQEHGRQDQANDLSQLMWYMDGMMRQFDAVTQELQEVKQQLSQVQEPSKKYLLQNMVGRLQHKVDQLREGLNSLWSGIAESASKAVQEFKEVGVSALDRAVSGLHIKNALESLQEKICNAMEDTKKNISALEDVGHELRSVGSHLKNAGRAMVGKETQTVTGGQEGRFQAVVLAPIRATQTLFTHMNNATLAAIGNLENLEQKAEVVREARAEQATQRLGKHLEKKPSIRQALAEKKTEAAARPAPAPDKEHKEPEVSL